MRGASNWREDRLSRRPAFGKRTALDRYNNALAASGSHYYLHPTKGYRRMTPKRILAATITAEIKAGMRIFDLRAVQRELRAA